MTNTWKKTKQGEGIVASSTITYLMIFTSAFKELEIGWLVWLPKLKTNTKTNLAEGYMNIRCKFDGWKFYNRVQRGSFKHQCYGAGLRFQMGPDWTCKTWLQATGSKPAEITRDHDKREKQVHEKSAHMKSQLPYKEQRKKQSNVSRVRILL